MGDDGTWTYNWYTSSTRSPSSLASANLIEGQHGSALTLTDEMAGSYLFVEITSGDGITVSGPRQANRPTGKLYGCLLYTSWTLPAGFSRPVFVLAV